MIDLRCVNYLTFGGGFRRERSVLRRLGTGSSGYYHGREASRTAHPPPTHGSLVGISREVLDGESGGSPEDGGSNQGSQGNVNFSFACAKPFAHTLTESPVPLLEREGRPR